MCVAKFDYAGQYETHGGADSSLYGGRDNSYAEAVGGVVSNDPPSGLSQSSTLGGFKVVQSDQHQIVYGADIDGLCKFLNLLMQINLVRRSFLRMQSTVAIESARFIPNFLCAEQRIHNPMFS